MVVFIDRQLAGFYKPLQKSYRHGVEAVNHESVSFAGHAFADLPAAWRLDVLHRIERNPDLKPFFDLLIAHAMQGFYGDPRHGGNLERASWKMLGVSSPPVRGRA